MVNSNMFKNILIKSKFWWDLYVLMFLVMGYYHFIDPTQFYFFNFSPNISQNLLFLHRIKYGLW